MVDSITTKSKEGHANQKRPGRPAALHGVKIIAKGLQVEATRLLLDPKWSYQQIINYFKTEYNVDISERTLRDFKKNYLCRHYSPEEVRDIRESFVMMNDLVDKNERSDYQADLELIFDQMKFLIKITQIIEKYVDSRNSNETLPDKELRLYMKAIEKIEELRKAKRNIMLNMNLIVSVLNEFVLEFAGFMDRNTYQFDIDKQQLIIEFLEASIPQIGSYLQRHLA